MCTRRYRDSGDLKAGFLRKPWEKVTDQVKASSGVVEVCGSSANRLDKLRRVFYDGSKSLTIKQLALAERGKECLALSRRQGRRLGQRECQGSLAKSSSAII